MLSQHYREDDKRKPEHSRKKTDAAMTMEIESHDCQERQNSKHGKREPDTGGAQHDGAGAPLRSRRTGDGSRATVPIRRAAWRNLSSILSAFPFEVCEYSRSGAYLSEQ